MGRLVNRWAHFGKQSGLQVEAPTSSLTSEIFQCEKRAPTLAPATHSMLVNETIPPVAAELVPEKSTDTELKAPCSLHVSYVWGACPD
jgi:hypothetical protein